MSGFILEFTNQIKAQACLDQINALGEGLLLQAGMQKDSNGEMIPLNANTGQPQLGKRGTSKWSELYASPDGTWYFPSPKLKFPVEFTALVAGFELDFTEKTYPATWIPPREPILLSDGRTVMPDGTIV